MMLHAVSAFQIIVLFVKEVPAEISRKIRIKVVSVTAYTSTLQ